MGDLTIEEEVIGQCDEATELLQIIATDAAARLDGAVDEQSGNLSIEEMAKRVTAAIAALKGGSSPEKGSDIALDKNVASAALKLESERRYYQDNRRGFAPHPAIDFTVKEDREISRADLLIDLLGEDAAVLMSDWGNRIDFTKNASGSSKVALFIDSNYKARNEDYAEEGAITTQDEDLRRSDLDFADDWEATKICAAVLKKAKNAGLDLSTDASSWKNDQSEAVGKLDDTDLDLLAKLRDGSVRSRSGGLTCVDYGRLRAYGFHGISHGYYWALGGERKIENFCGIK